MLALLERERERVIIILTINEIVLSSHTTEVNFYKNYKILKIFFYNYKIILYKAQN